MRAAASPRSSCGSSAPTDAAVWVHVLLRARYDEHGAVSEIVHAVRDISERKAQEAQLREARARFELAFEHAPIGMALAGPSTGVFIKVNRELCRYARLLATSS